MMKNSHKAFLQCFMSRGILTNKEVREWHKRAVETYDGAEGFDNKRLAEFVNTINLNIKPMHMEIKKIIDEATGTHCYGLTNTVESEITRVASDYSPAEHEFFKKLVEQLVESDTGSLTSIECLNLVHTLENVKMTKKEAEALLGRLQQDNWVQKSQKSGGYSLAPRSLLELEQYIIETYPDVTKCNMCSQLCLQGHCCGECDAKMHFHCAARFFDKKNEKTCPSLSCSAKWDHVTVVAASQKDAASSTQIPAADETPTSSSSRRQSRR